jgi:hypothetical protein
MGQTRPRLPSGTSWTPCGRTSAVISYTVSQRAQEFGIRVALGASPWDVVRMVAWEGLWPSTR